MLVILCEKGVWIIFRPTFARLDAYTSSSTRPSILSAVLGRTARTVTLSLACRSTRGCPGSVWGDAAIGRQAETKNYGGAQQARRAAARQTGIIPVIGRTFAFCSARAMVQDGLQ